ncbi:MAG: alpha-mannosidase [Hyphomonadaceae bacterium]|nr:alpha-mannosidase [Clostridia bacterium]
MKNDKKHIVPSTKGIEEILGRWREEVKGKQRRVFTFEEQAELKLKDLKEKIYLDITPADEWLMRQAYYREVGEYDYIDPDFVPIKVGETWGGNDVSCFFTQTVEIPPSMKGKKVVLQLYLGGDSLLTINGTPYQGMDPFRNIVPLTHCANGDEVYELSVESYYMWHFGESEIKRLECSNLAVVDTEMEEIYWDYKALFNAIFMPDIDQGLYAYLGAVINESIQYIDPYITDLELYKQKARIGQKIIKEKVFESGVYQKSGKLHLIGNSHLDIVFLWPYREFIRKLGRTHASMLRLMEEFPNFIFSQSQPAMYKEMKKHFPEIYAQVKERVKEGRWEVIGGMWVEPDCNLISGESFTRQLLFGTRFIEREFGVKPRTCWLPDVFGNCYTMPQILAKAGIEYFVTHKMCVWNDTNPWKTHTFWWEGPDGSRVFSVSPPTHFIGTVEPDHMLAHWNKYSDKENVGESLYCYGWGDGGGGVDPEMLQYVKRYEKFPGIPETKPVTVENALDSMRQKAKNIPVWKDELYLEAHRGVHTTKGKLKKRNRYAENLYREAELYSVIGMQMGLNYQQEQINEGWEKILTNQFHDSLPGSHISEVYEDLLQEYDQIIAIGEEVRTQALCHITRGIEVDASMGQAFAVFNSLSQEVTTLAYIDVPSYEEFEILDCFGHQIAYQKNKKLNGEQGIVFLAEEVPAVGYKVYYLKKTNQSPRSLANQLVATNEKMENQFFTVCLNEEAEIISIFDKRANREVLKADGKGNVFKLYEDIPSKYEAWDIVSTYLERELKTEHATIEEIEVGAVYCAITIRKSMFDSVLKQRIILYDRVPRIDFETEVDWVERKKLLKVGFDINVVAKSYTSDIAYGNIERPNYRYHSFDKAKFEVSAHQWIDLSQEDYGVSILNDCKYGHDVTEQKMSVTLLKGPTNPDPESDIELHYFTYSIYPHEGNWKQGETIQRGLELNQPLQIHFIDGLHQGKAVQGSYIQIDNCPNVTLEAVKKAEDSDAIILRVVEQHCRTSRVRISFLWQLLNGCECDLLENSIGPVEVEDNCLSFTINPYEIKTFKIVIKQ